MLNKLLLLFFITIFLHRHVGESSSCTNETHSLHGAAESFYAMVIVELVFILIVNFQHTILSLFMFTAACFFCHLFSIEAVCSIIKPSFSCF